MSLPTRERGLKRSIGIAEYAGSEVAPYAGAWIETLSACPNMARSPSLPTRERGLKHGLVALTLSGKKSLPTRERGLKRLSVLPHQMAGKRRSLRGSVD